MPIEIRKIVKESALILNVGIMVLVSTVILRYAIIPQIVLLRSNVSQYRSVNALISSEAGLTKIIGDIKTKNDRLQKKLFTYSGTTIESERDLSGYLEILINLAKVTDIRFVKLEPLPEVVIRDFRTVPIVLDFSAPYHALGQFTASVEKAPQMFKINRLFVEANGSGKVVVKMMITCFIPVQEKL
jgi:Tfp pilus assembly protein PilO